MNIAYRRYQIPQANILPLLTDSEHHEDSLYNQCRDKRRFAEVFLAEHFGLPFGSHHEQWFNRPEKRGTLEAIAAPRGGAKTTFFSFIDVLHAICYETEQFIIITSESKSLAVERVMDVKGELESNEKIIEVYGEMRGHTTWKQDDIVCANGVRVTAKGRGGQIRGSKHGAERPSLILLDDVESSETVLSPLQREKVRNWYQTDVRRAGRPDGQTNFRIVGTYLHQDALLPQLVENPAYRSEKYKAVLSWSEREDLWTEWKALYTDLSDLERFDTAKGFYDANQVDMLKGVQMLWPDGISYYMVQEAIVADGRYSVMKEFQNEPYDPEHQIFDMENAVRFNMTEEGLLRSDDRLVSWDSIVGASLFLDWAGAKDSIENCFACAVLILWERFPVSKESYGYLADCWLGRGGLSEQIKACFDLYAKYSTLHFRFQIEEFVKDITGEITKGVRRAFGEEKQRRQDNGEPHNLTLPARLHTRRHEKIDRIATALEPEIANGWLSFNNALPQQFMDMFIQFPTHEFVDGPDATEGAFSLKVTGKPGPVRKKRNPIRVRL
tara:strand:+ start:9408 stop:11069 length:1662 start_codon:yes stop_codon:yes gene_type:complete